MPTKSRKIRARYAVNISLKAWDIAKAGAAVTLKVRLALVLASPPPRA